MKRPLGDRELFTSSLPRSREVKKTGRQKKKGTTRKLLKFSTSVFEGTTDKSSTVSGRALLSASLFFMSNLASSVEECEECVRFSE